MTETPTLESLQAALKAQQAIFDMHQSMNIEVFYWWCTAIMFLIHAGFLAYEMGSSRAKNALAAGVKNILALALIIPTLINEMLLSYPTIDCLLCTQGCSIQLKLAH